MKALTLEKTKELYENRYKNEIALNFEEIFHSLYLVVYKVGSPDSRGILHEQICGEVFEANSMNEALQKFADFANKKRLTTYDIYAVDLYPIAQNYMKQKRTKRLKE